MQSGTNNRPFDQLREFSRVRKHNRQKEHSPTVTEVLSLILGAAGPSLSGLFFVMNGRIKNTLQYLQQREKYCNKLNTPYIFRKTLTKSIMSENEVDLSLKSWIL